MINTKHRNTCQTWFTARLNPHLFFFLTKDEVVLKKAIRFVLILKLLDGSCFSLKASRESCSLEGDSTHKDSTVLRFMLRTGSGIFQNPHLDCSVCVIIGSEKLTVQLKNRLPPNMVPNTAVERMLTINGEMMLG